MISSSSLMVFFGCFSLYFRWSLIAGRVPGRTDNQVKNHWNSHLSKKLGVINNFKGVKHKTKCRSRSSPSTTTSSDQQLNLKEESNSAELQQQPPLSNNGCDDEAAAAAGHGSDGGGVGFSAMWETMMMGSDNNYDQGSFWFYNNNEGDLNLYHPNYFMDPGLDHHYHHHLHDYPFEFLDDIGI